MAVRPDKKKRAAAATYRHRGEDMMHSSGVIKPVTRGRNKREEIS